MSNKVLAACIAALSLVACEEQQPPAPRVTTVVAPVITSKAPPLVRDAGAPLAVLPRLQFDAGQFDTLALVHDTPTVDHLARSKQLVADGDVKGALVEARRAVFTAPDDQETLTQVAKLARRVGQNELAAEAWGRVARVELADATPLVQQGRALLDTKDFAGAIMAGREAVARDEGNPEGYQVTGLGQLSLGELTGAIASFEKAVELSPQHGWALNNLGFAYLRANENAKAVEVLERASALLPTVAYVQNNLGVALERVGRGDEAKAAYQHAMDLSPKYVKARVNAARVAKAPTAPVPEGETMSDVPVDAHPLPTP
jgi:Flp pilus assembly protein TadD